MPAAQATTLCVNQGGTGGCLDTITAALSAAADGDTIQIAGAASPYFEHLTIGKSLSLVGDGAATTFLDGALTGQVIRIAAAVTVTLSNLAIRNGQAAPGSFKDGGSQTCCNGYGAVSPTTTAF